MSILGDLLFKAGILPISEMAEYRRDAERIIRGLNRQIILHLIKILYWKDEVNYNKHCNDIDTWLFNCMEIKLKPFSKRIPAKDYYFWLFEGPFSGSNDEFLINQWNTIVNKTLREYSNLPKTGISLEELHSKVKSIMKKVCVDLEKDEFNSIKDYL